MSASAPTRFVPLLLRAVRALGLVLAGAAAAADGATPATAQPADLYDFWVGDWDARWTQEDGSEGRGRNHVVKILDGRVIEENFEELGEGPEPRLKGRSISVLNPATGTWKQAWADNQGGWFSFTGAADGDRRMFLTESVDAQGRRRMQRMVFHGIRADAFTWDWESSADGGANWKRLWRIDYRRASR